MEERIHTAEQIQIGEIIFTIFTVISCTFEMCQSAVIEGFCPFQRFFDGAAVSTFVTHRPDHDTRTVLFSFHAAFYSVYSCFDIFRVIGKCFIPTFAFVFKFVVFVINFTRTMAFIIRFAYYVETIFVTKLIEIRCIGIMTGADRIEVMLLHHFHVLFHLFNTDHWTCDRIGVMSVYTMKNDWPII